MFRAHNPIIAKVSGSPEVPAGVPNAQMKRNHPSRPQRSLDIGDKPMAGKRADFNPCNTPGIFAQRAHSPVVVGNAGDLVRRTFTPTTTPEARDMKNWTTDVAFNETPKGQTVDAFPNTINSLFKANNRR